MSGTFNSPRNRSWEARSSSRLLMMQELLWPNLRWSWRGATPFVESCDRGRCSLEGFRIHEAVGADCRRFQTKGVWMRSSKVDCERTDRSITMKLSQNVGLVFRKLRCNFGRAVRSCSASASVSFEIANGRRRGVPGRTGSSTLG